MTPRAGPDVWERLLDPGEVIFWQGQPAPGVGLAEGREVFAKFRQIQRAADEQA